MKVTLGALLQIPGAAVMFFGNIKTEGGLAFSTRIFAPTVTSKGK